MTVSRLFDLRSDCLGPWAPTALRALSAAAVQAPGFSRHDDRHERALAEEACILFGMEDAVFLPTGTLANQIALSLWCGRGEAAIADAASHMATNEAAATAGLSGATLRLLEGERGHPSPDQIVRALQRRAGSAAERRTRLVWLENSHNRAGGALMPSGWQAAIASACESHQVALHLDGARLWHAAVASGQKLAAMARGASSLMVALNKIVGAPVGSLLLGSRAAIDEAARLQKMLGGLWRPVGPLAAAARAAMHDHRQRVEAAHEAASVFASVLIGDLGPEPCALPETNIVMIKLGDETHVSTLLARLAGGPVRVSAYGEGRIRCVFHAGLTPCDARAAARVIADAARSTSASEHKRR
jgi:threonine aldolase